MSPKNARFLYTPLELWANTHRFGPKNDHLCCFARLTIQMAPPTHHYPPLSFPRIPLEHTPRIVVYNLPILPKKGPITLFCPFDHTNGLADHVNKPSSLLNLSESPHSIFIKNARSLVTLPKHWRNTYRFRPKIIRLCCFAHSTTQRTPPTLLTHLTLLLSLPGSSRLIFGPKILPGN